MADTARGDNGRCLDCFETKKAATVAADRMNRRKGRPVGTYRCLRCQGWRLMAITPTTRGK